MRIKNIVKVMNFHSLIRVDVSKKQAEKYLDIQQELFKMIGDILNNKNIIIDNKLKLPDKILNIFIGSDIGFCGNYNSSSKENLLKTNEDAIIIGKKLFRDSDNVKLKVKNEELADNINDIMNIILVDNEFQYGEINILYFDYQTMSNMPYKSQKIFPIELETGTSSNFNDFTFEGDVNTILNNLISLYLKYQILISFIKSKCAENIFRKDITTDSLKKIEELEEEQKLRDLKIKKDLEFEKILETFVKLRK